MGMNWNRLIVLAIFCAAPLALVAQTAPEQGDVTAPEQPPEQFPDQPADQPDVSEPLDEGAERSEDEPRREGRRRGGEDGEEGRWGRMGDGLGDRMSDGFRAPMDSPDREDWERFQAFMKEHSPRRWAVVENHPDPSRQQMTRFSMFNRFRTLERLRNADHDMYQVNLRRFAVEDEIFALGLPAFGPAGRTLTEEEMSKLREKVSELVDIGLEERELRVQRLHEMLKREQELYAAEKAQREEIIADRVMRIERGRLLSGSGTMGAIGPRPERRRFGGGGPDRSDSPPSSP